ncbi:NAD(P)/FAD-dependent oxidoreductase [Hyphomicrobium sp.]|uniref:NAD(P)/FAD-dependent oxidoreductase n=1 Tax=Hyphomicrobium sp. TaxID=82 RepID=UPI000FA14B58|nr:NAD(P)/FAD-dependent oxidoreductase [Hyphomicrobium sp.]RUP08025.1 MAG: NAD(P)/FAD-dependent oxidoreductase [Hyphomicrobium sp.]
MSRKQEADIVIVGAGPVGLFAVFACGQLGMRCHVVDAFSEIGGQCIALYPEKPIYDIPGFPSVRGRELIARLREQAEPYHARFSLDSLAVGLRRDAQRLFVRTSKDEEILARAVIIVAGPGAFGPNRPPLAGIEALEGTSVHYWVRDPQTLRGKRIVIAGGGDSAVDWAIVLSDIAASVTLVHRRSKFRAPPASVNALMQLSGNKKVTLRVPYQVSALEAHERALKAVIIEDLDGERIRLEADVLLPFFGLSSDLSALSEFGLNLEAGAIRCDPLSMSTSVPGIFAAGDVASYPGKEKLLVTGFSEAAIAARSAFAFAYPEKPYHFQHSTDRGRPSASQVRQNV